MRKFIYPLICLALIGLCACTPARQQTKERANVEPLPTINEKITAKVSDPLDDANSNATSRVLALAQNSTVKNRFTFLGEISAENNGNTKGRIDIASNPFVRFSVTAAVKRDDLETFIKQAHQAHDNGEIGGVQWAAFLAAEEAYKLTGSKWALVKMQTKAINGKVLATFPGIFGEAAPIDKSLPMLWIKKFDSTINLQNSAVVKVLGASLPLLGAEDLASDMRTSLSAAIASYPFNQTLSDVDRAASLVLFQRLWSQLLSLKGYDGVKYSIDSRGVAAVQPMTDDQNAYVSSTHFGYFFDAKTGQNLNLSAEDIASYDPSKRLILLSNGNGKVANLATEISTARALGLAFEATSPAAYFVNSPNNYLLGDVTSTSNKAVIPDEAHTLSFGLLAMQLQNLVARRIVQVNENGQDVNVAGGVVHGLVLVEEQNGKKVIQLENVLQMIRFYVQMNSALGDVLNKASTSLSQLQSMNSFYKSPSAIDNLMKMRSGLAQLRVGLYFLTMDLVNAQSESATWDPKAGVKFNSTSLSKERKRQIGLVLQDLAVDMNQPLIFAQANKLLGEHEL